MPRVEFHRTDLVIEPARLSATHLRLRVRLGRRSWEQGRFAIADLTRAKSFPFPAALAAWQKASQPGSTTGELLPRVAVRIDDASLLGLNWETAFAWEPPVVRVTPVRPHTGFDPFKLPLRIVQVQPEVSLSVPAIVYSLFGHLNPAAVKDAVVAKSVPFSALLHPGGLPDPTSDVLHFEAWEEFRKNTNRLSFADGTVAGSIAWLARLCLNRQTRLLVLHVEAADWDDALQFAAALIQAGGPAILVEALPEDKRQLFYRQFYSDLIHDYPLDAMLRHGLWSAGTDQAARTVLFAGAGREDALRASTIGLEALRIPTAPERLARIPAFANASPQQLQQVQTALNDLKRDWHTYQFEFHESDGLLPLAQRVKAIQSILSAQPPRSAPKPRPPAAAPAPPLMRGGLPGQKARPPATQAFPTPPVGEPPVRRAVARPVGNGESRTISPRFVNLGFWEGDAAPDAKPIAQRGAVLTAGDLYQLGVDIGPRSVRVRVEGAEAIQEERFRWTPDMAGVRLEIGVTGIDFDVVGNPVRELWLPRHGASERTFFPVIPRAVSGIARLRVVLYHEQEVVQSFRIAAISAKGSRASSATLRKRLAASLGLDAARVGEAGYVPLLEYSTGSVQEVAERKEEDGARRISLVVNDWDSDTVITLKGPGIYAVRILADDDIAQRVKDIRARLQTASTQKLKKSEAYAFGLNGDSNRGTPEQLAEVLKSLVVPGWRLFDKIVMEEQRDELERLFAVGPVTVHVAHILREKVIPWNLLYDRPFDANMRKDDDGNPVAFAVCPASLPDKSGTLPARLCFENSACLLHGHPGTRCTNSEGKALLPETVVCPAHFWGFRHRIEVPPQQVAPGQGGRAMPTEIVVKKTPKLISGVNCSLSLYQEHLKQMAGIAAKYSADWTEPLWDRQRIIKLLKQLDWSLIYFYCHASGGEPGDPELLFRGPEETEDAVITPDALSFRGRWEQNPLVFLNGCGTVGYTPEALTPFLKKLVDDRGASGIVGTEIPVWEELAGEFALHFFTAFLNRQTAGEAMLSARRQLLAQNNPLGLVYTLYAAAELALKVGG